MFTKEFYMRYAIKVTNKETGKSTIAFEFSSRAKAQAFCDKANEVQKDRVSEVYDRKQG